MRFAEIGLFLAPFALVGLWWFLGTRKRWLLWVAVALTLAFACATAWLGLGRRLPAGTLYVPATLQHGEITPGHGA